MVLSRAIESVTNLLSSGFQASRQLNRTSQLNSTAAGTREEGPERQQSTSSAADQLRGVEEDSRPVAGLRAQIKMFYHLVKNINHFHGRGVLYGPTQFEKWRSTINGQFSESASTSTVWVTSSSALARRITYPAQSITGS